MPVAKVHKSYLNKDQDMKKMVNPKLCCLLDGQTNSAISDLIYFQEQKLSHGIIVAVPWVQINAAVYFIAWFHCW